MKKVRKFTLNKILVCLLTPLMCVSLAFGLYFTNNNSAEAMTSYPWSPSISKPLFDYGNYSYDKDALDELARAILDKYGDSNTTVSSLIDEITRNAKTHGKAVSQKNITVAYGRYSLTGGTETSSLVWMPVYMSTSRTGDAILTMYLASTNGPKSAQEMSGFTNVDLRNGGSVGQYTTHPNCGAPSNMYGVSYIRSVTLGNQTKYMSYDANHSPSYTENKGTTLKSTESHKYLDLQTYMEVLDTGSVASMGYLYDDLATPSEMLWQSYESYAEFIGDTGAVLNGKGEGVNLDETNASDWAKYCFPNEAYDAPRSFTKKDGATGASGTTVTPEYNNANFDYKAKPQYTDWQNDKVWLPSLTEVGTGDWDGSLTDSGNLNGLWKLTAEQRGNARDGGASWLRTANTVYAMDGQNYSTYSMFCCEEDGSIGTHSLKELNIAVRPAIHLNLTKAIKKINPPVALPETVETPYIGAELAISDTLLNVESAESWYVQGGMHVRFFPTPDCNLKDEMAVRDAGTYYMKVYLDRGGLYFAKAPLTQTEKVVKFVVSKAKLGVDWVYQNNRATDLVLKEGQIYDWDKKTGLVPEISISYESATGQGSKYYSFDDLLRDTYFGYGYIKDEDKYKFNYELYDVKNPNLIDRNTGKHIVKSDSFAVGRKIVKMPYFVGYDEDVDEIDLDYASEQFVQLVGADKYFNITVSSERGKGDAEKVGVSDEGYLTFKLSEPDTYTLTLKFENNDQFTWYGSAYDFDKNNNDTGADFTERTLKINVKPAKVDVEYVNLPAEWNTITNVTFSLDVRGIYGLTGSDIVRMNVYYENNKTGRRTYPTQEADGTYKLNGLAAGDYTMYATLADERYEQYYYMDPSFKMQRFNVVQTVSTLGDNDIKWQYTHDGTTSSPFGFADHDSEETAIEFDFDDKYFVFALTLNEIDLHDKYYVKADYDGDTFVKNAGLHKVEVLISAFNKNVQFEDRSYTVYFRIRQVKFDLSDLEWNYDMSNPPVYNGATKKITLTPESLNLYPGLTAEYECNGDATGAGSYETTVNFILSGDYAVNYVLPVASDINSYEGEFAFTCQWLIAKAKLTIEWNEPADGGSSGLLFVPTLKTGAEYCDYVYQHKEADGTWTDTTNLTAQGANETYRVKAVVKPAYANNYEIENDIPCEFEVASGKHPVSVHFEHNGETVEDGAEFAYTGTPLSLSLVVDAGGLTVQEYSFKYYLLDGGKTELSGPPTEVGNYMAEVTAKYGSDSYVSNDSKTEIRFNIIKADFDPSQIFWIYEHGGKIVAARYDAEQGKWVDELGREVIFSFEYDGTPHTLTVSCQQEFANPDDFLTVLSVKGNEQTNAGSGLTAFVEFSYNTDHFNNPVPNVFPRTLTWEITKKQINYNEIRWGYVDKNGAERDFDFENDEFLFTRDENGIVGITVRLIGLPEGIQDLISYQTQNLTEQGAPTTDGNTRYLIGEYLTSFTISGTWSDPNYVDFDANDFPNTIHRMCSWQIARRPLSKLDYQDGFATFDDRVHSVIELCNIPEDELYYISIDITFVDSTGVNVSANYKGYEDVANMIYHAGTYDIRIYELVGEDEIPVLWDYVRITVAKSVLHVEWDEAGNYPVARVKDVYSTDMVGTKYFNENDAEVPLAYVKSTKGENFYAKACVTERYEKDVDIIVDGKERVDFTYKPYDPADFDGNPVVLEFPYILEDHKEYTGHELTFEIDAWETYYSKYLYIADGNLKATAEGEYRVMLRFKKDANAYWQQADPDSDYNRNAYTLTYYVDPPSVWGLDYPTVDKKRADWTGEAIEFKITNWSAISKYVDYEVMYRGQYLGNSADFKNGVFHFTHGGTYTIIFTIPDDSIGVWVQNPDAPKAPYMLSVSIDGDPNIKELPEPELNKTTAEYTGSAIQFRIDRWSDFANYVDVEIPEGVTFDKNSGIFTATGVGSYKVTLKIKAGSDIYFAKDVNGIDDLRTLTFSITGVGKDISRPHLNVDAQDATGNELTFYIVDWSTIYKEYLDVTCNNSAVTVDGGTFKVTAPGKYEITLTFKEGLETVWRDTNDQKPMTLKFTVNEVEIDGKANLPSFVNDEIRYTGKDITFVLNDYNKDKIEQIGGDSLTQKEVGTYKLTFRLKGDNVWADTGATGDREVYFKIAKAQIDDIVIGADGKPSAVDKDGNRVDFEFDEDMFEVKYKDKETGEYVDKENLVPGREYIVELVVKDTEKFDNVIENGSDLRDKINDKNSNSGDPDKGGFPPIIFNPDFNNEGNGDGGFNSLWWIAIGGGALALIAILGLIIGLATRNRADGGYEDDYYDDEYDYDDDYDDYDDDYDDYDY